MNDKQETPQEQNERICYSFLLALKDMDNLHSTQKKLDTANNLLHYIGRDFQLICKTIGIGGF